MNKYANNNTIIMDSMFLNSGDVITLECKLLNNKPWYNIIQESPFNKSSFYDGNNFDRCLQLYSELNLAFKGVKKSEEIIKRKSEFEKKIESLKNDYNNLYNKSDMYFSLKSNPLFLGMSDF